MAGGYASLHRLHVREVKLACFQGGVWELILGLCVGVGELAVDYRIDHEKGFVTVRAHGPIVLQELLDYFDALVVQNDMGYGKYTDEEVMRLAARLSAYPSLGRRGAAALVTPVQYYELATRVLNLDK